MPAPIAPFFDEHPFRIYEKILEGKVDWSRYLEVNAKDLIKKLLVRDVTRRLGSLKVGVVVGVVLCCHGCPVVPCPQHGVEDVKQHKWFKSLDWDAVLQRKIVVSGSGYPLRSHTCFNLMPRVGNYL